MRDTTSAEQLATVRAGVRELYRRLSGPVLRSFGSSISRDDATVAWTADRVIGAQRVASAVARHLGMGDVRLVVGFRSLGDKQHAGEVELGAGPTYYVAVDAKYRDHPGDLGAVLAHEVMHVFLHRRGIRFAGTPDNEILTDVATAYLGVGWPMLQAQRTTTVRVGQTLRTSWNRLGYLTPESIGYVLAKREDAVGDDISGMFTRAPDALAYYKAGRDRVAAEQRVPPLRAAGAVARLRYRGDRDAGRAGEGYRFESARVVFSCPTCHQSLRAPVDRVVTIRCTTCSRTVAVRA